VINNKQSGSFYTPIPIADFLVDYLSSKLKNNKYIKLLEPSAGNGVFVNSLFAHKDISKKILTLIAVEKEKKELNKITSVNKRYHGIGLDFLEYQKNNKTKFSVCIGNPPYIKKNLLTKKQILLCEGIHAEAGLSDKKIKNIWSAFLIRCVQFLESDGILAFVLPAELLQVKYAAELRDFIVKEFERIEIFTFNELLFKDVKANGQDALLLIGEKKSNQPGVFYSNIEKVIDLKEKKYSFAENVSMKHSKWTHPHLTGEERGLLEKIKVQINTVNYYSDSKAGIVTAANDYFIVNTETVKEYKLKSYVEKIVQRGVFVNGSVVLDQEDFRQLIEAKKPTYLITLNEKSKIKNIAGVQQYLKIGIKRAIHERYKTSIRDKWYEVPNVGKPPEAFFFKRCNEYPKLIKNDAKVLATDSAYKLTMKDGYGIESLIYSFYNSLTLAFAELYGRYYGGGVLELTPNEFKSLPVPYVQISKSDFATFRKAFEEKESIKDVLKTNDKKILKSILKDIDDDSIKALFSIREKLYRRRIKSN
jgi:adenine-specific DNA-methyltransferase